jgi:hypothetical protein
MASASRNPSVNFCKIRLSILGTLSVLRAFAQFKTKWKRSPNSLNLLILLHYAHSLEWSTTTDTSYQELLMYFNHSTYYYAKTTHGVGDQHSAPLSVKQRNCLHLLTSSFTSMPNYLSSLSVTRLLSVLVQCFHTKWANMKGPSLCLSFPF